MHLRLSSKNNVLWYLSKILLWLPWRYKTKLIYFAILLIIGAVCEIFVMLSVVPFVTILTDRESAVFLIRTHSLNIFEKIPDINIIYIYLCLFALLTTFSCIIRMLQVFISNNISASIGTFLSCSIYRRSILQDYQSFVSRNSSLTINTIASHLYRTVSSLQALFYLLQSTTICLAILASLALFSPLTTFLLLILTSLVYVLLGLFSKPFFYRSSLSLKFNSQNLLSTMQESFSAYRELVLFQKRNIFLDLYYNYDSELRKSEALVKSLSILPRYIIEFTIFISVIAIASFSLMHPKSDTNLFSILGLLSVGTLKILPSMQQIYGSWAGISATKDSIIDVFSALPKNISTPPLYIHSSNPLPVIFSKRILLDSISFAYPGSSDSVLRNLSLEFIKDKKYGLVGKSGSGKSTIINIIICLLNPNSGKMLVDDILINSANSCVVHESWQSQISFVPQTVAIFDASISYNITFKNSLDSIEMELLYDVARKACLLDDINSLQDSWNTKVGERGSSLSGGQVQRIGIARALFVRRPLLILDEATSALDFVTEKCIMNNLYDTPGLTLISISHRLSSLSQCDEIIDINKIN